MTLMETGPLPESSKKRLFAMGENVQNFQPPVKRRAVSCIRTFPKFCGPNAPSPNAPSPNVQPPVKPNAPSPNVQPPVKRRAVSAVRSFPKFCGPNAPRTPTFEDISMIYTGSPAVAAVPLSVVAPEDVHVELNSLEQSINQQKEGRVKVEDGDDCVIIKSNDNCSGNDKMADSNGSRESRYESPLDGEVHDDAEVLILSPSEWNSHRMTIKDEKRSETERAAPNLEHGESSHKEIDEVDSNGTDFYFNGKVEHDERVHDLSIVCYTGEGDISGSRREVLNARKVFDELCEKFLQEIYEELKGGACHIYARAASHMKKEKEWVNTEPRMGHVPGVEIGDRFGSRGELLVVGLHHQQMAGINWMKIDGKNCANSIVDSGRYENKTISTDTFVYSGHGGNEKVQKAKKADQKLVGGNLALKNSMDHKYPVRVIRKYIEGVGGKHIYVYEGLYMVSNFWLDKLNNDQSAYMFEMTRLPDQVDFMGDPGYKMIRNKQKVSNGYHVHPSYDLSNDQHHMITNEQNACVHSLDDLSNGKEKLPIGVVNEINNERPPYFTYITNMKYPNDESNLNGCGCINGCSDNELCRCGIRNGGELPFNEEGCIVKVKRRLVHECGPACKCPPSCQNRVSQHGIRYWLEVFKTKVTGWGVRSLDVIPSGGFVCEYIGELLNDKEADKRVNDDEYLFDLDKKDGFTIDALKYGNVGRFINHSCSPNLYAQKVLYDLSDKRIPHIMFFATKDLPPLTELTYDYNYNIGRVCDAFGNIKIKTCRCGSHKCTGRLY